MRTASPTELPAGLEQIRQTDAFTQSSVPAGLLKDHSTKEGTWGLIHVIEGRLRYCITDDRREPAEAILTAESGPGIVEPTILHFVEPLGAVRFYVEFLR